MFNKNNFLKKVLLIISSIVLLLPSNALTVKNDFNTQVLHEADRQVEIVKKYLSYEGERGDLIIFNEKLAVENEESKEIIEIGKALEQVSIVYSQDNEITSDIQPQGITLPVWGNYCGPGYGGKNSTKPATDILDEGCRRHDQCYKGIGYKQNCTCNRNLINYISANLKYMNGTMYATALAIRIYFQTFGLIGC